MSGTLKIVLPVYNDWASFQALLKDIDLAAGETGRRVSVLAVDDGSSDEPPEDLYGLGDLPNVESVERVDLALNLGHQRALAIGICAALDDQQMEQLVVMDADGEDRPRDIGLLLRAAEERPESITVAQRRRRNEKLSFRLFYKAYKWAFLMLTGKEISFGNFCLLSRSQALRLSMVSELWNNLPAAMMRSRLPIHLVPIDRGRRYFGSSKMGFVSLSLHGMSAYSV